MVYTIHLILRTYGPPAKSHVFVDSVSTAFSREKLPREVTISKGAE